MTKSANDATSVAVVFLARNSHVIQYLACTTLISCIKLYCVSDACGKVADIVQKIVMVDGI